MNDNFNDPGHKKRDVVNELCRRKGRLLTQEEFAAVMNSDNPMSFITPEDTESDLDIMNPSNNDS